MADTLAVTVPRVEYKACSC